MAYCECFHVNLALRMGDRRAQNFREGRIPGPSQQLPGGNALLQIAPTRYQEAIYSCVADRRDFYHQVYVTDARATTNCVYPFVRASDLVGLRAHDAFLEKFGRRHGKRRRREEVGDYLRKPYKPILCDVDSEVACGFGALYQGDHLGVEFATDAHANLLVQHDLLRPGERILSKTPLVNDQCVSGLVIDDFFSLSREGISLSDLEQCKSVQEFRRAKKAYEAEKLQGSDDKDVVGSLRCKIIGAEIISEWASVRRGAVVVGSPFEKTWLLECFGFVAGGNF